MKPFPRAAAFISGVALHVAFLFVVGFLAAVHIPRAYFDGFGEHRAIGRALEEAFVMALPTFLLAAFSRGAHLRAKPERFSQRAKNGLAFFAARVER